MKADNMRGLWWGRRDGTPICACRKDASAAVSPVNSVGPAGAFASRSTSETASQSLSNPAGTVPVATSWSSWWKSVGSTERRRKVGGCISPRRTLGNHLALRDNFIASPPWVRRSAQTLGRRGPAGGDAAPGGCRHARLPALVDDAGDVGHLEPGDKAQDQQLCLIGG